MTCLTISKLELQAALLASGWRQEVQRAVSLNIERCFRWTDSKTVLQLLHSLGKQPVFIANRVTEILELTTVDEWNHVPTGDNPADAGTRGMSATALFQSSWLKCPEFLTSPNRPFILCTDVVITTMKARNLARGTELMKNESHEMMTLTAHVTINASTFEWQNYSSYEKFLLLVAYMLRLLQKFSGNRTNSGSVTYPDELLEAESRLFLLVQTDSFPAEKTILLKSSARLQFW